MVKPCELLYTADQVRRLDRIAIEQHGIAGIELMERAGLFAFEQAMRAYQRSKKPWVVLCGAGNNGGDGYIVARLAREQGLDVRLFALKPPADLTGDAATAAKTWHQAGGASEAWTRPPNDQPGLIVDALLGTGLDRAPGGSYAEAIMWVNEQSAPVIAIDIPSGLAADTGNAHGSAVSADVTTTFIGNKRGLYTADGPDLAGCIRYSDLGTPDSVRAEVPDSGILIQPNFLADVLPPRKRNSHKGSYGWVVALGGNTGMSGAIRLCGEAALRGGAGKVTIGTRATHAELVNTACAELMVRGAESTAHLDELLELADVLAVGTGLGQTAWSERVLATALQSVKPMVLDADALNLLSQREEMRAATEPRPWILTPHPAEAARLLQVAVADVQSDRVVAALELARAYSATVVLKGCGTVIADATGQYAICASGNPGMATAGSGDVLTGLVAALMAQGLSPWDAACAATVAHAAAGDQVAREQGERGMIATDIARRLPLVLNPGARKDNND